MLKYTCSSHTDAATKSSNRDIVLLKPQKRKIFEGIRPDATIVKTMALYDYPFDTMDNANFKATLVASP